MLNMFNELCLLKFIYDKMGRKKGKGSVNSTTLLKKNELFFFEIFLIAEKNVVNINVL